MLDVFMHKRLVISMLQNNTGPAFPFSGEHYLFTLGSSNSSSSSMTSVVLNLSKWKQYKACYSMCSNFHPIP